MQQLLFRRIYNEDTKRWEVEGWNRETDRWEAAPEANFPDITPEFQREVAEFGLDADRDNELYWDIVDGVEPNWKQRKARKVK